MKPPSNGCSKQSGATMITSKIMQEDPLALEHAIMTPTPELRPPVEPCTPHAPSPKVEGSCWDFRPRSPDHLVNGRGGPVDERCQSVDKIKSFPLDADKGPSASAGGNGEASPPEGGLGIKVQLAEAHSRVFNAFSRAFSRQNNQFEKAIRSLDSLNDQIVEFVLIDGNLSKGVDDADRKQRVALAPALGLMRRLLLDAQVKFRKMVEENQQLATRIDGELESAHKEVHELRQELAETNRKISEMQVTQRGGGGDAPPSAAPEKFCCPPSKQEEVAPPKEAKDTPLTNGTYCKEEERLAGVEGDALSHLRRENELLSERNSHLLREIEDLKRRRTGFRKARSVSEENEKEIEQEQQQHGGLAVPTDEAASVAAAAAAPLTVSQLTVELHQAKGALLALKNDRKRLKSEKFDLLNQMKQLYATLEDKEKELREFIRNYEQRMRESDESLRQLAAERDESEREKWNLLKHARDEAERAVNLAAQLGLKDATLRKLEDELETVRKQMASLGYGSDAESLHRTSTYSASFTPTCSPLPISTPTPSVTTPTCSPLPLSTGTSITNGRGSSADSGVRFSSDKDSTASHEGGPGGSIKDNSSIIYATPSSVIRDAGARDNNSTASTPMINGNDPHTCTGLTITPSNSSNLVNSNNGGLSRSAEQLCERVAEAAEAPPKTHGLSMTLSRKGNKGNSTWGSISRVFARQKKRAAVESSLYEGVCTNNPSDKRSSWCHGTPQPSTTLTEESYSEKLRLLEEAQHIPLERWKAQTVLAWLEITLGMPQYGAMCAENIRSGKVILELNDSEIECGLGISHPMHRKKIRLAVEELREPCMRRFPKISVLSHTWVTSEWLPDLGLSQYRETFSKNLVDGRMLEALNKKDLEKYLGVTRKFHQASIINGVHLLRIVQFDRHLLAERRRQCENADCDPVVWTNYRWYRWARSIDLLEYADNLRESGVHGALVVLENSFSSETMATALGIPASKNIIRRHLATEFNNLVIPARKQMEAHAKFAKIERRRHEKMSSGGSLGRSFSKNYSTLDRDKRRSSLRPLQKRVCSLASLTATKGSLSRALGIKMRDELDKSSPSGSQEIDPLYAAPRQTSSMRCIPYTAGGPPPVQPAGIHQLQRPRSSVVPSSSAAALNLHRETHRRVRSISDIDHMTMTPV